MNGSGRWVASVAFFLPSSVFGFSAGPHYAATEAGLATKLDPSAINVAYIANFQVDYMYQKDNAAHCWHRNAADHQKIAVSGMMIYDLDCLKKDFADLVGCSDKYCHAPGHQTQYFHFQNYPTGAWIERGLQGIERALKSVAVEARTKNDPEMVLNGLGIALHAIQDLYTHSTVSDESWRGWIGTPNATLDDIPRDVWATRNVKLLSDRATTGFDIPAGKVIENVWNMWNITDAPSLEEWPKHGPGEKPCSTDQSPPYTPMKCGINHDSVVRKGHMNSLRLAVRATRALVDKLEMWVSDNAFWQKVRTFSGGEWVNECRWRAQRLSSLTGQWGYPARGPLTAAVLWESLTDDCSNAWQDDRWRVVLDKMYGQLAAAMKVSPADPAVFGSYAVVAGDTLGILEIKKSGASCSVGAHKGTAASILVGGKTIPLCAAVEGLKVSFVSTDAKVDFDGEVTLMSKGKKLIAGFTRTAGVPNGIWGSKQK